jgi:hypothetical protein
LYFRSYEGESTSDAVIEFLTERAGGVRSLSLKSRAKGVDLGPDGVDSGLPFAYSNVYRALKTEINQE